MTEAGTPGSEDLIGTYAELPFPPAREVGIDTVRIGMARHHIPVVAEVDVTVTRAAGNHERYNPQGDADLGRRCARVPVHLR